MSKYVYLKFADGTRADGYTGEASQQVWLYFTGLTMAEAAAIVLDPARMSEVRFVCGRRPVKVYTGYHVIAIIEDDGEIKVQTNGGTTTEVPVDEGDLGGDGTDVLPADNGD